MAITVFSALFGMMLPTDSYCFWGLETTIRLIFAHIPWKWRHVSFLLVTHIPHHSRETPPLRSSLTPKNGRYHQLLRDFTKIWSRIWGSRYPPAIKHSNGNPSVSSTIFLNPHLYSGFFPLRCLITLEFSKNPTSTTPWYISLKSQRTTTIYIFSILIGQFLDFGRLRVHFLEWFSQL